MIYTVENTAAKGVKVRILDSRGHDIDGQILIYDSVSKELTLALTVVPKKGQSPHVTVWAQDAWGREVHAKATILGSRILLDGMEENAYWESKGFEHGHTSRPMVTNGCGAV